jgi:hypothetical protein
MFTWLKEPLLHFLVLGALIFALYGFIGPDAPADDEIVVTRGQQEHLVTAFSRTWQRPPTQTEFNGIVDDWIREEIAYRESQTMGLDTDDTIIRRRLRQKLEVLAEDIVSIAEPTPEALAQYLADNQADYTLEPVYTLRQVYFSVDRRRGEAMQDAEQALLLLQTDSVLTNPEDLGDPISLRHRYVNEREGSLAATFGLEFTEGLMDIEPGNWSGPVRSGYGLHLVLIEEFMPGRPLTLAEAERDVRRDWAIEQRVRAIDTLYESLREKYTITVEPMAAPAADEAAGP